MLIYVCLSVSPSENLFVYLSISVISHSRPSWPLSKRKTFKILQSVSLVIILWEPCESWKNPFPSAFPIHYDMKQIGGDKVGWISIWILRILTRCVFLVHVNIIAENRNFFGLAFHQTCSHTFLQNTKGKNSSRNQFAIQYSSFSENLFSMWNLESVLNCYFVHLSKGGIQVLSEYTHIFQFTRQGDPFRNISLSFFYIPSNATYQRNRLVSCLIFIYNDYNYDKG